MPLVPRFARGLAITDLAVTLEAMRLPSLLDLVEDRSPVESESTQHGMRVSGGAFGPDRAIKERVAFYGMPCIFVDNRRPSSVRRVNPGGSGECQTA